MPAGWDEALVVGALERMRAPVAVHARGCRLVFQNAAHRRLFGEARGRPCGAWLGPAGTGGEGCPFCEEAVAPVVVELPGWGAVQVQATPLEDGQHQLLEVVPGAPSAASLFDALKRLCDAAGTGLFLEDLDGVVLDVNRVGAASLGCAPEALRGRPVLEFLAPENAALLPDIHRQLAASGGFRVQSWQTRPDGERYLAEVFGARLGGGDGDRLLVAVRDLTDARLERGALQERSDKIEAFLHSVAHDLRTPLVGVKGFAGLLLQELEVPSGRSLEFASRVLEQAERLEGLLDGLVHFAKAGSQAGGSARLDLARAARSVWEAMDDLVERAGATLELEEPLPEIHMAPVPLHQLLTNLLGNAVKYRRQGVRPVVRVRAADACDAGLPGGGWVGFAVEDNGVGVPAEDRARIFEPFRQGSVERGGLGLGLAIVQRLVESRGGRIWVESAPEGGSRFVAVVPGEERR